MIDDETIKVCSACGHIVIETAAGWKHLLNNTPICKDAVARFPNGLCKHGFADWCPRGCFGEHYGR